MTRAESGTSNAVRLAPDDGLFDLPGGDPTWIWVHTCPDPECSCRSALVLATTAGRDALLERGAVVRTAWEAASDYAEVASKLEGVDVFQLDIDTGHVTAPASDEALDLAAVPHVRAIVDRIDGDLLDAIGRLWYRGKGRPDPELRVRAASEVVIRGWQPGDLLAYSEMLAGVRRDFYVQDDCLFEASELYCIRPDCECGEVIVDFTARMPRGAPPPGRVKVKRSGTPRLEPTNNARERTRLERLWSAFRKRHPKYVERFARRYAVMKDIGTRVVPAAVEAPSPATPGRNAPCPCGSGKKFKRCCGRTV